MYRPHTLQEYNEVIELRKLGYGPTNIFSILSERGFHISYGAISDWIYTNKKPFQDKVLSKINVQDFNLTKEKAYILGVLCGDGYIRISGKGHFLVGLDVCDEDFADEFRKCLIEVYGLTPSKKVRYVQYTNFSDNPKPRYVINLSSKLATLDLLRYSKSFRTKEWQVPKDILNGNLDIKSAFLRGLFDSEGSVTLKKGGGVYLSVCSGNRGPLQVIREMLKDDFDIGLNLVIVSSTFVRLKSVSYRNIKNFSNKINFTILRKKEKLELGFSKFKRKGHRKYSIEFKNEVLRMLDEGFTAPQIGKRLGFPHTNVYDFIEQKNRNKSPFSAKEGIKDAE